MSGDEEGNFADDFRLSILSCLPGVLDAGVGDLDDEGLAGSGQLGIGEGQLVAGTAHVLRKKV